MIKLLFILLLYSSRSWYIFAENNNSRFGKNGQGKQRRFMRYSGTRRLFFKYFFSLQNYYCVANAELTWPIPIIYSVKRAQELRKLRNRTYLADKMLQYKL